MAYEPKGEMCWEIVALGAGRAAFKGEEVKAGPREFEGAGPDLF